MLKYEWLPRGGRSSGVLFSRLGSVTPATFSSSAITHSTMNADFVFINVQKPRDALKLAKDSRIRAHVTRRQWRQTEQRSQEAVEKVLKKAKRQAQDKDLLKPESKKKTEKSDKVDKVDKPDKLQLERGQQGRVAGALIKYDPPHSSPAQSVPVSFWALPIDRPFGGLRGDPFRSYPVAWRPFLPQLVDHCTYFPSQLDNSVVTAFRPYEHGRRYP